MKDNWLFIIIIFFGIGCTAPDQQDPNDQTTIMVDGKKQLPILGERKIVDGKTVFHQIPDFSFINQDSMVVNNATFKDKIYVVDFFFTSCPTICPKVKKQVLRLYDEFEKEPRLQFLSHSIDVKYDTQEKLNSYGKQLGISSDRWHLVTGVEDEIFEMADDYFIAAHHDSDAPGGFDHSGRLILVDQNRHVRGFAEGTEPESVTKFMGTIRMLLDEK